MIIEILMLIAATTIFIVLARRFPATSEGPTSVERPSQSRLAGRSWRHRLLGIVESISRAIRPAVKFLSRFRFPKPVVRDWVATAKPEVTLTGERADLGQLGSQPDQKDSERWLAKADQWFAQKEFDKAEQAYLRVVLQLPREPKIYSRLGVIYLDKKNYRDAKDALTTAVKLDPSLPSRHYNLALAWVGLNDRKQAVLVLQRAVNLDPGNDKYRRLMKKLAE